MLLFSIIVAWSLFFCSACTSSNKQIEECDRLNDLAYASRYKNVDSTRIYALKAFHQAEACDFANGMAEALLNEAFFDMARMNYHAVDSLLSKADSLDIEDNVRLMIAIQRMKYCQRRSLNKDFYTYKYQADNIIKKYNKASLSERERAIYTFAKSEYGIVLSTYLYYVNQTEESSRALLDIIDDRDITLLNDTAQYLAFLYNVGAGGILNEKDNNKLLCKEFDYLMQCYILAHRTGYTYWEANSLQGLSEHIASDYDLNTIKNTDAASLRYLNEDGVNDTLLAGNLAERALQAFVRYGDLYQIAGSWRTLSYCYQQVGDYEAAVSCLLNATSDTIVKQSPDLLASIYEKLSMAYSALDNKQMSDYNRNLYLDIQDSTRQDRKLEARVEALKAIIKHTNNLIYSTIFILFILTITLSALIYRRKKIASENPEVVKNNQLDAWLKNKNKTKEQWDEEIELLDEEQQMISLREDKALRINIEQHAKTSFVQSLLPLIDRMLQCTTTKDFHNNTQQLEYINDICHSIVDFNDRLTSWIQLQKGQVLVNIETFNLNELFEVIRLGKSSFEAGKKTLNIRNADYFIKADKILTTFILNTVIDNAKKHISKGGEVNLYAEINTENETYIDINIADNGEGMTDEQLEHLFDEKEIQQQDSDLSTQKKHGFGLANCRSIINKYKKISGIFSYSDIKASSKLGQGTKITLTLPRAILSLILLLSLSFTGLPAAFSQERIISIYADSVFNANVEGDYAKALLYADSCIMCLNSDAIQKSNSKKITPLTLMGNNEEFAWYEDSIKIDYDLLIWLRNEIAVAALALHDWELYEANNSIYTKLYKEKSKDVSLNTYCQEMEHSELLNNIFVIILIFLFLALLISFWFLFLRDVLKIKSDKAEFQSIINKLNNNYDEREVLTQLYDFRKKIKDKRLSNQINDTIKALTLSIEEEDKHNERVLSYKQNIEVLRHKYNRYYIANNLIDNSLSSLKHETMYFPSRIAMIVKDILNEKDRNNKTVQVNELTDLIKYYRQLYSLLSTKLLEVGSLQYKLERISLKEYLRNDSFENISVLINKGLFDYLISIIKGKNEKEYPTITIADKSDKYVTLQFLCSNITLSDNEVSKVFSLDTNDTSWLIIRQIIRETGSSANAFACGVKALSIDRQLAVSISLPLAKHETNV